MLTFVPLVNLVFWKQIRLSQWHLDVWFWLVWNLTVAAHCPVHSSSVIDCGISWPWRAMGLWHGRMFHGRWLQVGWADLFFPFQAQEQNIFCMVSHLTVNLTTLLWVVKLCCVLASSFSGWSVLFLLAGNYFSITCFYRETPYVRSSLFDNFELMSDLKLFSACNYYNKNTKEIDFLYSWHYIILDSCLSAKGLNMINVIYFPTSHLFNYLLELRQERPKKERGDTNLEYIFNKMLQKTTDH